MEDLNRILLLESRRADLEREFKRAHSAANLPGRPAPWRALLVTAVLLIGMIAWWIH